MIYVNQILFISFRFDILRFGDGCDELPHFLLLQGINCEWQRHDVLTFSLLVLQVDQSWANSTVLDALTSVPDYEECRALCRV